jgi:hypothetical protein
MHLSERKLRMNRNVSTMTHEELVQLLLFSDCPVARETARTELRARLLHTTEGK